MDRGMMYKPVEYDEPWRDWEARIQLKLRHPAPGRRESAVFSPASTKQRTLFFARCRNGPKVCRNLPGCRDSVRSGCRLRVFVLRSSISDP